MNWYKTAIQEIANMYLLFQNVFKDLSPQYGLIFNGGDILSPDLNRLRVFITSPDDRHRFTIDLRMNDNNIEVLLRESNTLDVNLKKYTSDEYSIVNDILRSITDTINQKFRRKD